MSIEKELMQAKTNQEKVSLLRKGIRTYIENIPLPSPTNRPVSQVAMEYGDALWALGMLATIAEKEAKRLDDENR
ncbi:hypothetical protein LCGC14_0543680 [marine sediment metagenome]|uniref:Uncharacterized protein n=1 Tax=marine sediment metagenome TaxID=412755 RepID=A0A0F9RWU1_9ZZZZ